MYNRIFVLSFFTGQSNQLAYSSLEQAVDALDAVLTFHTHKHVPITLQQQGDTWVFPDAVLQEALGEDAQYVVESVKIQSLEFNPGNPIVQGVGFTQI